MHIKNLFKRRARNDEEEMKKYSRRQEKYNDMLKNEIQKQKFLTKMSSIKVNTFTKKMVAIIIFMSIVDIQLSYILAFLDKANTVEGLSTQLCITILGVAFVYMVRAYFDSKAEHKNLDDDIKEQIVGQLSNKISEILNNAGVDVNPEEFTNSFTNDVDSGYHINNDQDN